MKQALAGASNYAGSTSRPRRRCPAASARRSGAHRGPGVGFRKARTKLSKGWDGDAQRLDDAAAVHVAPGAALNAPRHRRDVNHLTRRSAPSSARWRTAPTSARTRASRATRRAPGSGPDHQGLLLRERSRASAAATTRARFLCRPSRRVRKHLATYLDNNETLSVDFIATRSVAHLIDHLGDKAELNRAKAMGHSRAVPYLDWWALANSADIVVRRHAGCIPRASTFSTTARAWGARRRARARRARPDFDGLV